MFSPAARSKQLLFASAVVCLVCGSCRLPGNRTNPQPKPSESVTFTAAQTAILFSQLSQCDTSYIYNPEGTWSPTFHDVIEVDHAIRAALAQAQLDRAGVFAQNYRFQYFGIIVHGRRKIFVNGFHEALLRAASAGSVEWRSTPIVVCDAGIGEFQTEYDVSSHVLAPLQFATSYDGRPSG